MSTPAPKLPPGWGPRPHGRSAHSLLAPLYDYADVTEDRLTDLEARSGTSVTLVDNGDGTATISATTLTNNNDGSVTIDV